MSKRRWIICRETGALVEVATDYVRPARDPSLPPLPAYHADITPYASPITGQMIGSKSARRDELRAHGCVDQREVGRQVVAKARPDQGDYIRKGGNHG